MISKSDVSIVIPTMSSERNEYALRECLISLRESDFPMENILIAVNGQDLPSEPLLSDFAVKVIWVEEQGQCKATNAAVATVSTPWVMVSNDDMVYPSDWFERLIKGMLEAISEEIDRPFTVSPQLIEPRDGAPTFKKVFFGGVGGDFNKQGFIEYAKTHVGEGIRSGFNLPFLINKEVWDLVGGYDVSYDPWGSNSDSDFEYKLKLAGVEMWQNTNCPVYHFSNTSPTFHPDNHSFWQKNYQYFIDKWGFERASSPEIWTTEFEIPFENLKYRPKWSILPEVKAL